MITGAPPCRHEAERLEQKAKGALERQKITDEAEAEKARKELLELQANSAAVESTGQAKAEAQSHAEASKIEGEAAVQQAKLKAQASKIEAVSRGCVDVQIDCLLCTRNLTFLPKTVDYNKAFLPKSSSFFVVLLLQSGRYYKA